MQRLPSAQLLRDLLEQLMIAWQDRNLEVSLGPSWSILLSGNPRAAVTLCSPYKEMILPLLMPAVWRQMRGL